MPIAQATFLMKGGTPKAPPPPTPLAPTTVAENVSADYRAEQRKRAYGFSSTILGGMETPDRGKTILGG